MDDIKISLIIPVFNVEDFLRKTLLSVVNQTFNDYEVIIVNDGSTDNSIDIINEFVNKYDNFRTVTQENAGPSKARNTGLKLAKGEFIAFLDSDDRLEPNFLKTMYELCIKYNASVSYCGFYVNLNDKFRFPHPLTARSCTISNKVGLRRLIRDTVFYHYPWNKIYKRSIFFDNDLCFPEDMFFEDIATVPLTFAYSNKIVVTSKHLYNYTKRKGSILHTMDVQKINDYIKAHGLIRNFLENNKKFDEYKRSFFFWGVRCLIINLYSITRMHILSKNFRGFISNIRNGRKSAFYIMGNKFKAVTSVSDFKLPYEVKAPKKKS